MMSEKKNFFPPKEKTVTSLCESDGEFSSSERFQASAYQRNWKPQLLRNAAILSKKPDTQQESTH
jgi:hypothetical protein